MLSETVNNSIKEETNMKKKIGLLSLLLVLAMCLAFLPGLQTEAEAAAASSITVNGYNLPSGYYLPTATWTKTTTKPSGSYFYYSGGTLTIYNVTLTSVSGTRAVYAEGDLVVSLSGTNKLTTNNANGIRSTGTLKFTGSGSLTVSSAYNGVFADALTLKGGKFTAISTNTANDSYYMALAVSSVNLANIPSHVKLGNTDSTASGAVLYNDTNRNNYDYVSFEPLVISIGGTGKLTITGDDTCIYAGTGCTTGATTLKLTSNSRNGIQVLHGNFTMNGGDLDIYAKNDGINAERVTINGGTALIKSSNMTSDSNHSSIRTGNFVVGSGLRVIGSTDPTGAVASDIDVSKLRTYDYIKVDKASTIVSGPLNGTVTGMQETANVNLALYKSGQAEPAYEAVRLGNGSFTFTSVEYGTYTLKATATGYQDFTTTVTVSGSTPSVTVTMTKKSSGNITVECVGDISYTVSGSVVKVTHDVACKVGYLSGSEYVAITPTKNSDGSYSFTAPAGVTNVLLVVKGDVNGDGKVTSSDYSRLNAVLLKKTTMAW